MLRLYDTRHRVVEDVVPATSGLLRIYSCGPTVYRYSHVGNMRAFLLNDLILRVAALHDLQVHLVVNITDVGHVIDDSAADQGEDRLVVQARSEARSVAEIARFYEDAFHADLAALNITPARAYPRASEYIPGMIQLTQELVSRGHAYVGSDFTVYFDARSFPGYGTLSGNRIEDLRPSQSEAAEEAKRFHADWALWKRVAPDAPVVFDSPWGPGFPGWHLECSAMSTAELGEVIDIHTGGIDLRFPHHEDERAQTEAAVGHEVVRHWVHSEHLTFDGRKMAKSTGNVVLVSDLASQGLDPLALRLTLLASRYRQQSGLSWEALVAADRTLRRWRARVAEWAESPSKPMCADYLARIREAFDDDLDTPSALVALRELERDESLPTGSRFETFAHVDRVLGLDLVREVGAAPPPLPDGATKLLEQRERARSEARWSDADQLRTELAEIGVAVTDTAAGQTWRRARGGT
ncbi:MAG: cysteine--tRNA ligase [Mycobacteriales bacterium]